MDIYPDPENSKKAIVSFDNRQEQYMFTQAAFPLLSLTGLRLVWEYSAVDSDSFYPRATSLRSTQLSTAAARIASFNSDGRNPILGNLQQAFEAYINVA